MERVSDEQLDDLIILLSKWTGYSETFRNNLSALTELRERRAADESPDYSTKSQPSPMGLYRCNNGRDGRVR